MRILVTGSEGFIGKHLVPYLESRGHKVERVDKKLGIELHHIQWEGLDAIIHLAAQTSVWNDDRFKIARDNVDFFMQVVDMSNATGAKLVYASSSCANPDNITSMYGLTKAFDEIYARIYARHAIGLRLHNVYGANPRKDTLLGRLEYSSKNKVPIELFNNGNNVRHFTYVGDVVSILAEVVEDYTLFEGDKIWNVRNPVSVSTLALADAFCEYNDLEILRNPVIRNRDKTIQSVDLSLPTITCNTNIYDGMEKIYGGSMSKSTRIGKDD